MRTPQVASVWPEAEHVFRWVVEGAPNGIIVADVSGRIVLVNRKAEELFGYSREEFLGMSVDQLVPVKVRGGHELFRRGFISHPESRPMGAGRDLYALRKDGTEVPVEIGLTPLETPSGLLVVSSLVDITARKNAEMALLRYAADLERSNSELERFASVASHDLQEPLRKIRTFAERLQERTEGQIDDRSADFLGRMIDASQRMQSLIGDLLAFSRITTQANPFQRINLNEIVSAVLVDLEVALEETNGVVQVDPMPLIEADPSQMRQLFQNLIGNALKFRQEGQRAEVHITSRVVHSKDLEVRVKDNGIGFDSIYRHQIFEIFERLHGRGKYAGTGVGLAICRKLVERHGGSIRAESEPGQGASFIVTLPIRQN